MRPLARAGAARAVALTLAASIAAGQEPDSPLIRHRAEVDEISYRARHPEWRTKTAIGRLDDAGMRARAAEIARDLAQTILDPAFKPYEKYLPLEQLQKLGPLAAPATGALVSALHAHDTDTSYAIPYFCTVTRAMATVGPADPRVIRALTDSLAQDQSRGSVCHTCGCALDALKEAGPLAAPIAAPVLDALAKRRLLTTYSDQLAKAIEAMGAAPAMVPSLLARAADPEVLPDDRAASLRTAGKAYAQLAADQQEALRRTAEMLLGHEEVEVRITAAEVLGEAGPPALGALTRGLGDAHYKVRAASARALARLGPEAAPARPRLLAALDPFLGTGEAAAEALVAIGPAAEADVQARVQSAPPHLRPLVEATAQAIRAGGLVPVGLALVQDYAHAPGGVGYVHVDVLREGRGQAYAHSGLRIKARVRGGAYAPPAPLARTVDDTLTADNAPNAFFAALEGRRAGDRLRVFLSPETTPNPYSATEKWNDHEKQHAIPFDSGAVFEVDVTDVCEPVIWTVFRGSGIWGPIRFELYCR